MQKYKFETVLTIRLFLLLLFFTNTSSNVISLSVSTSNLQINSQAQYSFFWNRQLNPLTFEYTPNPSSVPLNSVLVINFPSQFLSVSSSSALPCSSDSGTALTCTVNSASKQIIITDYYLTSATQTAGSFTITIKNIQNAYKSGASDQFGYSIVSPTGTTIDEGPPTSSTASGTSLTFVPGSFPICSASTAGAYVSSWSTITFDLKPTNTIPPSGQLIVSVPLTWQGDVTATETLAASPTCLSLANVSNLLTCSYSVLLNRIIITLSQLTASSLSDEFQFSIGNILTPPFVGSTQSLTIYSQWPDGSQIDTCTSQLSKLVAAPLQAISFASTGSKTVQSTFTGRLSLTLSRSFYYQDTIAIDLPDSFRTATVTSINFQSFISSFDLNTLKLSNFPSVPDSIPANNEIILSLANLVNPSSSKPITLTISFLRLGNLYQQSSVTYSASPGVINSFTIAVQSTFVNNVDPAMISISSTSLSLLASSSLIITYPASITASNLASTSLVASLNGISVSGATYYTADNRITINNLFISTFSGSANINISKFVNPPTVEPKVYTLVVSDQYGFIIMSGTYTLTATLKGLVSSAVSFSSATVLDNHVTYSLTIMSNYPYTSVMVIVPTQIAVGPGYSATCAPNSFSSCNLIGNQLTFLGIQPAGSITITWGDNTNPSSLAPTDSFSVFTYYNGYGVELSQGSLAVTMNTPAGFKSSMVAPSLQTNSATISVPITTTLPIGSPAGTFKIVFPQQVVISAATCPSCTVYLSDNSIMMPYTATSTLLTLTVSNVFNAVSFKPISSFQLTLYSTDGYPSVQSTVPAWTNTMPSVFLCTLSSVNGYRNQNVIFLFQIDNLSRKQAYIVLTINNQFGPLSVAPANGVLLTPYTVSYQLSPPASSYSMSVTLLTPSYPGNFLFTVASFTADNFQMGSSVSNSWTFDCSGTQCKSCYPNLTCSSCYSASLSSYSILNSSSGTCERSCAAGNYLVTNNICHPCDPNCLECVSASTNCTSCPANMYLFLLYHVCSTTCLPGYYPNDLTWQCTACVLPCLQCLTALVCSRCIVGYYKLGSDCLLGCPANFYVSNSGSRTCDACAAPCLTCSLFTYSCTSCNNTANLYLQSANRCVSTCDANYFLENNICTACKAPCLLCTTSSTTCQSCSPSSSYPIWLNYTCISASACPIGYYILVANYSCNACPVVCTVCSSSASCSACATGYSLLNHYCVSTCPNTTFPVQQICTNCIVCLTCTSLLACTSCIATQYLYQSTCQDNCPPGTYISGVICATCSASCLTCLNSTYCSTCIAYQLIYQGVCYENCPAHSYANLNQCVTCPSVCANCVSASSCLTCSTGYSLQNSFCILKCSHGVSFYQVCYPCGLHCAICLNYVCTLCDANYYLYNSVCLSQCPIGMLSLDNLNCVDCTVKYSNCTSCTTLQCLTCKQGKLLNGVCVPCSEGTYSQLGTCASCPAACKGCTNLTSCSQCASNFYKYNDYCVSTCPLNMIPNGTDCTPCLSQCSVCNLTNSLCSVCIAGIYLYKNLCVSECPAPTVISLNATACITETAYYEEYSKASKIIPFPFSIAAFVLALICVSLKCFRPVMHIQTTLCSLVSLIEFAAWIVFLFVQCFNYANYHSDSLKSMLLIAVALAMLLLMNCLHIGLYCRYIVPDNEFIRWSRRNRRSSTVMLCLATVFNFKLFRFVHSKTLEREQLSLPLTAANKLLPFSLLSGSAILFSSIPVIVGCGLSLYFSVAVDHEFYAALDTLVVSVAMVLLIVFDFYHPANYFIDELESNNIKNKTYQEEFNENFDHESRNPFQHSDQQSQENIAIYSQTGDNAVPPSRQRLLKANMESRESVDNKEPCSDQSSQLSSVEEDRLKVDTRKQWQQKKYDRYGYLLRQIDDKPVRFDEHGYRVQISEDGVHHKYNADGNQVKIVDGQHLIYNQAGHVLKQGAWFDERGYRVRNDEDGNFIYFHQDGYRVLEKAGRQELYDDEGYRVEIKDGLKHRFGQNGLEVVNIDGTLHWINEQGECIRLNGQEKWELYDPADPEYVLVRNQKGGYDKYDRQGLRIVRNQYGDILRYDKDNYRIVELPNGQFRKYDADGYRVEIDNEGTILRFDNDGFKVVTDATGKTTLYDKFGYRVQKDYYGAVKRFDDEGYTIVIVNGQKGQARRYNPEGFEVVFENGQLVYKDMRGNKIVDLGDGAYEKYDPTGNRIWLDDNGYEVAYDQQGNKHWYNKLGESVDYSQHESSEEEDGKQKTNKKKTYYRRTLPPVDFEGEYSKLVSANKGPTEEQEEQVQISLKEFHDSRVIPEEEIEQQYLDCVSQERAAFVFEEQQVSLSELQEIDHSPYVALQERRIMLQPNLKEQQVMLKSNEKVNLEESYYPQLPLDTRILRDDLQQQPLRMKSVADLAIENQSHSNQGVEPLENKTQYDEEDDINELPRRRNHHKTNRRSERNLNSRNDGTQTVYNYSTVQIQIKGKQNEEGVQTVVHENNPRQEQEEIATLEEQPWEEQLNPMQFKRGSINNANTCINGRQRDDQFEYYNDIIFKDAGQGEDNRRLQLFSGQDFKNIDEIDDEQAEETRQNELRQRKGFKLSGAPNPLVEYAKTIEADRKGRVNRKYSSRGRNLRK